ncbi:MAG: GntR family transcriptional regulator [Pacificimonas sp.]|jgi:GntR family transcriptional regulator|nr:GntR family transcriptional regulator [Pacificimonas sp.]
MKQSDRPIYLQIRDRIAAAIIDENFGVGEALPSVRMLAAEESVNPLTVSKAYQELQVAGIVEARRGLGLFVVAGARERLVDDERRVFLTQEWPRVRAHAERLGISLTKLVEKERA